MSGFEISKNHFEIFGLPQQFELAEQELTQRYKDIQRRMHPDTVTGDDDLRKRLAVQASAHVNEAYRILHNPLERAAYLLDLHGYPLHERVTDPLPQEFLLQQMQLREELETVAERAAVKPLLELCARITRDIDNLYAGYTQQIHAQQYAQARETVRKLQFFHKLLNEADELKFELEH
jgi:molecular chaperone HscB